MVRQYKLDSREPIGTAWFWHMFYANMFSQWYDHDFQEDDMPTNRWAVGDDALQDFTRIDLSELAEKDPDVIWRDAGVRPSRVLLRFLADCSNPANLKRHLEHALANLD
jgi:hypothetical protein